MKQLDCGDVPRETTAPAQMFRTNTPKNKKMYIK